MKAPPSSIALRTEALSEMLSNRDGRQMLAGELEGTLFRHALDAHWPATRDSECGGFLTGFDRRWQPIGPQTKSLEFQARQTWAFARAARLYPGRGYDEAARTGFAFLTAMMWDGAAGGFFTLVDRTGRPLRQGRKHPHGSIYALEACIELAPLIGEEAARLWAGRVFDWLEDFAWDQEHGGYGGYYHRDNVRMVSDGLSRDGQLDWLGTPIGLKDMNVQVDALGALAAFAACGWDERAAARLEWHVSLFLDRLLAPFVLLPQYFSGDWSVVPDIPRSGQSFQLIACLLDATAGTARETDAIAACKKLSATLERFFAHSDGGYIFGRSIDPRPLRDVDMKLPERIWWIQTEASRGWLRLALLEPEATLWRNHFARQWAFVEHRLIDPRFSGFYENTEDGDAAQREDADGMTAAHKTRIWKDVSHEAHLLMDAAGWLRAGKTASVKAALPL